MDKYCMCEKIEGVARDGKSTCMKCGGRDAYGARARLIQEEVFNDKVTCEAWEDNEYIICLNNHPIGMTVTKKNGEVIKEWLENRSGLSSIKKTFANGGLDE